MINGTIVDTSVWIDYFNAIISDETNAADRLLEDKSVIILPVILQEILQGIREKDTFDSVKGLLLSLDLFQLDRKSVV